MISIIIGIVVLIAVILLIGVFLVMIAEESVFIAILLGVLIYGMMGGIVLDVYQYNATHGKEDWTCTAAVGRVQTTYVMIGKVMTPVTSEVKECTQYNRGQ